MWTKWSKILNFYAYAHLICKWGGRLELMQVRFLGQVLACRKHSAWFCVFLCAYTFSECWTLSLIPGNLSHITLWSAFHFLSTEEVISTDWDNSVQYIREEKEDVHQAVNEQGLIERAGETKLWPLVSPLGYFSYKIPTLQEPIATGTC